MRQAWRMLVQQACMADRAVWSAQPAAGAARSDCARALLSRAFASLPPHTELTMPALSPTMSQGNIATWQVKEGDEVAAGDVLCEVETDKATMAWENQDEGFVAKILLEAGAQNVPVGTAAVILVDDAADIDAFKDYQPSGGSSEAGSAQEASQEETSSPPEGGEDETSSSSEPDVPRSSKIGPAAQLLLQGAGLSKEDVTPSGPGGIVTKGDVMRAIADGGKSKSKPAAQPKAEKPAEAAKPEAKQEAKQEAKSSPPPPKAEQKKAQPEQKKPQPAPAAQEAAPSRPTGPRRSPDSKLRGILAEQMLRQGQRIPESWLRDWVGAGPAGQQQQQQQQNA